MSDDFWEHAARQDPLWAILSDPEKRNRRWDPDAFFETGRREIARLWRQLDTLARLPRPGSALDFGCGVGRLTQALAPMFDMVTGVDVSPTMIRLAERLNPFPDRVRFLVNARPDLEPLPSAALDFVYSDIALQHIPPDQGRRYIAEFLRLLRPGGITVFQMTTAHRETGASARPGPMPAGAYAADLSVAGWESPLETGARARLFVTVTNRSSETWDAARYGVIRAGNHWLDAEGTIAVRDDGRTALRSLAPGEEETVPLSVRAPAAPGTYVCEIDLVHENVVWFADRGSTTVRRRVEVVAPPQREAAPARHVDSQIYAGLPDQTAVIERFPMYGIPREDVLEIVRRGGGRAFHLEPDDRGGAEWIGFRYFAVKD